MRQLEYTKSDFGFEYSHKNNKRRGAYSGKYGI